jgi:hypothetical protein
VSPRNISQAILAYALTNPGEFKASRLEFELDYAYDYVMKTCQRLAREGKLRRTRPGHYVYVPKTGA